MLTQKQLDQMSANMQRDLYHFNDFRRMSHNELITRIEMMIREDIRIHCILAEVEDLIELGYMLIEESVSSGDLGAVMIVIDVTRSLPELIREKLEFEKRHDEIIDMFRSVLAIRHERFGY